MDAEPPLKRQCLPLRDAPQQPPDDVAAADAAAAAAAAGALARRSCEQQLAVLFWHQRATDLKRKLGEDALRDAMQGLREPQPQGLPIGPALLQSTAKAAADCMAALAEGTEPSDVQLEALRCLLSVDGEPIAADAVQAACEARLRRFSEALQRKFWTRQALHVQGIDSSSAGPGHTWRAVCGGLLGLKDCPCTPGSAERVADAALAAVVQGRWGDALGSSESIAICCLLGINHNTSTTVHMHEKYAAGLAELGELAELAELVNLAELA